MRVPQWRAPTLATLTDKRFSDPDWIFERKLDGVRGLAFRDGDQVRLMSRNRLSLNNTYPEIVEALAKQDDSQFVVDGEIVAFEGRRTSFARLQGRSGITDPDQARASGIPVFYYVFDVLHLDGKQITELPLIARKRLLRNTFQFSDPLRFTTHRVKDGEAAYRAACQRGNEGVIATLRSLHKRLSRTEQDAPAVTRGQIREPGAHWVRPTSVAQVAFSEWTRDGKLRHPRYLGLRTDKSPDEVVRETS